MKLFENFLFAAVAAKKKREGKIPIFRYFSFFLILRKMKFVTHEDILFGYFRTFVHMIGNYDISDIQGHLWTFVRIKGHFRTFIHILQTLFDIFGTFLVIYLFNGNHEILDI